MKLKSILLRTLVISAAMTLLSTTPSLARVEENLIHAVRNDDVTSVKSLLANGANPNQYDGQDVFTPLLIAVQKGYTDIVKILLANGANVNQGAHQGGVTALILAAGRGNSNIVKILLAHGANPLQGDDNGVTPLDEASSVEIRNLIQTAINSPSPAQLELSEHRSVSRTDNFPSPARLELAKALQEGYKLVKDHAIAALKEGPPLPPLSESYRREMIMGLYAIKAAKGTEDYMKAFDHFLEASKLAPWAPQPYEAMGRIAETLKDYKTAGDFFKLYLRVNPKASDARSIQDRIYVLEEKSGEK